MSSGMSSSSDDRDHRQRVHRVVRAHHLHGELAQVHVAAERAEAGLEAVERDALEPVVRGVRAAVGDVALLEARQQRLHVGVIEAEHVEPVERHPVAELDERVLERVERLVVVHVLGVDVGDDGDRRVQVQEAAVALVGLDHHQVALAELGVAAEDVHLAADHRGGVEAGGVAARWRPSRWWWSSRGSRRSRRAYLSRISSASISARGMTGIFRRCAPPPPRGCPSSPPTR